MIKKHPIINLEENIQKINSFKELKKGWNLYDADPIPLKVIENALSIIKHLKIQPKVFPTAADSIFFEYDEICLNELGEVIGDQGLIFEIKEDKIGICWMRDVNDFDDYDVDLNNIDHLNSILDKFGFEET